MGYFPRPIYGPALLMFLFMQDNDGLLPRPLVNYEYNVNGVRRNWPRGNSHGRFKVSLRGEYGLQNFRCFCRFCQRIGRLRSKPFLCLAERLLNFIYGRRVDAFVFDRVYQRFFFDRENDNRSTTGTLGFELNVIKKSERVKGPYVA